MRHHLRHGHQPRPQSRPDHAAESSLSRVPRPSSQTERRVSLADWLGANAPGTAGNTISFLHTTRHRLCRLLITRIAGRRAKVEKEAAYQNGRIERLIRGSDWQIPVPAQWRLPKSTDMPCQFSRTVLKKPRCKPRSTQRATKTSGCR